MDRSKEITNLSYKTMIFIFVLLCLLKSLLDLLPFVPYGKLVQFSIEIKWLTKSTSSCQSFSSSFYVLGRLLTPPIHLINNISIIRLMYKTQLDQQCQCYIILQYGSRCNLKSKELIDSGTSTNLITRIPQLLQFIIIFYDKMSASVVSFIKFIYRLPFDLVCQVVILANILLQASGRIWFHLFL